MSNQKIASPVQFHLPFDSLSTGKEQGELHENRDWLNQKYWGEKLSTSEIAKICGKLDSVIYNNMVKLGIKRRTLSEAWLVLKGKSISLAGNIHKNKDWFYQKYWGEGLSVSQIAELCEYSDRTICNIMNNLDIKRRAGSEAAKGIKNRKWGKYQKHSKEHKRKAGREHDMYGSEFNKKLKNFVRKRDNYQCQECGVKENGKPHDCHHINYDKNNSEPYNLITLCNCCHPRTNGNRQYWQERFERSFFNEHQIRP